MKKLLFHLLLIVLTAVLLPGQNVGENAVDFTAVDMNGNKITLSDFYDKVVLLDFWGTWCGPCRREIPNLIDIKNTFKNYDFEIISIAMERFSDESAKRFVKENKMNWVHIIDKSTGIDLAKKYNIYYVPKVFLIKKGKIVAADLKGISLKNKIKQLLQ